MLAIAGSRDPMVDGFGRPGEPQRTYPATGSMPPALRKPHAASPARMERADRRRVRCKRGARARAVLGPCVRRDDGAWSRFPACARTTGTRLRKEDRKKASAGTTGQGAAPISTQPYPTRCNRRLFGWHATCMKNGTGCNAAPRPGIHAPSRAQRRVLYLQNLAEADPADAPERM